MSLINEALKKAQRQRTVDPVVVAPAAPGTSTAPVARIAKRRPPMPARTQVILIGGSAGVLLAGAAVAFLLLRPDPVVPMPVVKPPVAVTAPDEPVPVVVVPRPAPPPPVVVQLPVITPKPPAPAPAVTTDPAPTVSNPTPVVVQPAPLKPAPLLEPVANPRVHEFLETLRISGIRVSDTDPKVLMNDRVFRLNDLVDRATQLRLTKVEPSTLTFVDATGFEYRKNF